MRHLICLLFASVLLFSTVSAQSKEPSAKENVGTVAKDTVAIPVYISLKTDTIKVEGLLYVESGVVKYCEPGWVIAQAQFGTTDGKNAKQLTEWKPIGALDSKRKPVQRVKL